MVFSLLKPTAPFRSGRILQAAANNSCFQAQLANREPMEHVLGDDQTTQHDKTWTGGSCISCWWLSSSRWKLDRSWEEKEHDGVTHVWFLISFHDLVLKTLFIQAPSLLVQHLHSRSGHLMTTDKTNSWIHWHLWKLWLICNISQKASSADIDMHNFSSFRCALRRGMAKVCFGWQKHLLQHFWINPLPPFSVICLLLTSTSKLLVLYVRVQDANFGSHQN
mgnify:CR=1 FL=1